VRHWFFSPLSLAKVLHPRSLGPAAFSNIPVEIWNTMDPTPEMDLTRISKSPAALSEDTKIILAVAKRTNQTMITLSSFAMWETPGFLGKVFVPFQALGISVDLGKLVVDAPPATQNSITFPCYFQ
jgi:aspartokinase